MKQEQHMGISDLKIIKVYSGRVGCMCGCRGKWSYTAYGAENHSPGYDPNVNERSVKIITNRVTANPRAQLDDDAKCWSVEENGRVQAVYFA
jgi:hypothetical protein